ncbi:MAG: desulfoferrodoxin [Deltaproteobacteria bacterium]|nr:desulfoferrodoxin [Deltaproteobacteria bacterium]MBW2118308.1 desulfoferrodoxin [Deltaproteobacteria bacterium]MBW2345328.1 desulfoferrodoxin [Deltaproteobacteria bacterium]
MNDRRGFLKTSMLVAAGIVASKATNAFASLEKFPAGIVYTKDKPGKWAKKVGSHAPKVKVEGKKVTLTTRHPMSEKHYIVRHTLISADGKVIGSKTFYPSDKEAVSTYELSSTSGSKLYATSFCNLHDFWLTEFNV